jgi:pteridine reductase
MVRNAVERTALVTGAGRRVGRALAEGLAADGCALILHCRKAVAETEELARKIQAGGGRAVVLRAELSREKDVLRLARRAEAAFGRVDVLVNSAAIFRPTPLARMTPADLDEFMAVNFKAAYVLCTELGRRMKARGRGIIVNIDCLSADRPWRDYLPYSISKAALRSLTLGLAQLLAPEVRVNGIAPGTILPPQGTSQKEIRALENSALLKRIGSPADILLAVRYLISAEFVTGEILYVDGGRRLRGGRNSTCS